MLIESGEYAEQIRDNVSVRVAAKWLRQLRHYRSLSCFVTAPPSVYIRNRPGWLQQQTAASQ